MFASTCAAVLLLAVMLATIGAGPAGRARRARQLYNQQLYNLAIDSATTARRTPQLADAATLVVARSLLERFRKEASGRRPRRRADRAPADSPGRPLTVRSGRAGHRAGRAPVPGRSAGRGRGGVRAGARPRRSRRPTSRERVLDWWASAVDRQAHMRPEAERAPLYSRIVARMEDELRRNAASAVASYWLVAGARGSGDLDRAWDAAFAAWARASFTGDRRAQLRADLDQIVTQAIIPERARLLAPAGGAAQPDRRDARRVGRAQAGLGTVDEFARAAIVSATERRAPAALSASCSANTMFFPFIASSACSVNRFAMSYCACASTLSAR